MQTEERKIKEMAEQVIQAALPHNNSSKPKY